MTPAADKDVVILDHTNGFRGAVRQTPGKLQNFPLQMELPSAAAYVAHTDNPETLILTLAVQTTISNAMAAITASEAEKSARLGRAIKFHGYT